jgi:hypothetical protein
MKTGLTDYVTHSEVDGIAVTAPEKVFTSNLLVCGTKIAFYRKKNDILKPATTVIAKSEVSTLLGKTFRHGSNPVLVPLTFHRHKQSS